MTDGEKTLPQVVATLEAIENLSDSVAAIGRRSCADEA
jgi:hypothetical protein